MHTSVGLMANSKIRDAAMVSGWTLIEMMLALTIGLLLMNCLFSSYITSQNNFQLQAEMLQMQDHAKMILNILSKEIHQTGYIGGCASFSDNFPVQSYVPGMFTAKNGFNATDSSITIKHAASKQVELAETMTNLTTLRVKETLSFKKNHILIISDCRHADIFRVKNVFHQHGYQLIKSELPLSSLYPQHAEISHFESNRFFVEKSTLYVENIHRSKIRIADGVDALHIHPAICSGKISGVAFDIQVSTKTVHKTWYGYAAL